MEVGHIPGIRIEPVARVRRVDTEVTVPFEIEEVVRPDDNTYAPVQPKATSAEDPENDTEEVEAESEQDSTVNFFA